MKLLFSNAFLADISKLKNLRKIRGLEFGRFLHRKDIYKFSLDKNTF